MKGKTTFQSETFENGERVSTHNLRLTDFTQGPDHDVEEITGAVIVGLNGNKNFFQLLGGLWINTRHNCGAAGTEK